MDSLTLPGKTLKLKCGQTGCCLVFGTFSGLRKHLDMVHKGQDDVLLNTEMDVNANVKSAKWF